MSASASQCEAHVKSSSGKNTATGDEEASVRRDDLFIVFQISTALCSLSQSWTLNHIHVTTGPGCFHARGDARAELHGCRNWRKICTKGHT